MTPAPQPPSSSKATVALSRARVSRAAALTEVAEGKYTAEEMIQRCCDPDEDPALLRITVRELLASQPGWSLRTASNVTNRMAEALGEKPKTIAWLIDRRTGGKRWMAYLDATAERALPWTGYPWQPPPEGN